MDWLNENLEALSPIDYTGEVGLGRLHRPRFISCRQGPQKGDRPVIQGVLRPGVRQLRA